MIQDTICSEDSKIKLYCPEEASIELRKYITQLHNTNSLHDLSAIIDSTYIMNPISPKYNAQRILINKQLMLVETVSADHTIPTVVYGFSCIRDKLDPKYSGLSGKELGALRKEGICITSELIEKKFCYVLDTSIKILSDSPFLLEYPIIIIECTFLFDEELPLANLKKHIHWQELKPYIISNPKSLFILTHFSMRYKDIEIDSFFKNVIDKESITNIHVWLTDPKN
jgi:hypothetical protein